MSDEIQKLNIENDRWKIELTFQSTSAVDSEINSQNTTIIKLKGSDASDSILSIQLTNHAGETKTCQFPGIYGFSGLYECAEGNKPQTVKLSGDHLLICANFIFFMLDLKKLQVAWELKADYDFFHCFYDLKDDYLLHGEIQIYGIDAKGNIMWSQTGMDIWVNIHGKEEVQITDDQIILTDFSNNVYVLDIDGPKQSTTPIPENKDKKAKWYQIWK